MKVADFIADWIASISPRVYAVCGAGAMHLNDAICHHPGIEVMAMHHEQAAAFAAEADARVSGKPGVVLVTAGPGGTNAITGIASAYVDSIPMIVISGQVTTATRKTYERQLGLNELDGTTLVHPVTKYATTLRKETARSQLEMAAFFAKDARPGPVWIEVPLDVQNAEMEVGKALEIEESEDFPDPKDMLICIDWLRQAVRPLVIVGNGARCPNLCYLLSYLRMPVVSSWNGSDLFPNNDYYIGRMGIFGDRASNYAVQNADVILAIGTRFSVAQMGHSATKFAPYATKIIVDIDPAELEKPTIKADLPICSDAEAFCKALGDALSPLPLRKAWLSELKDLKQRHPTMRPEYRTEKQGVNVYYFIEQMQKQFAKLPAFDDAVVVTDVGVAFIATMQTLQLNGRQRLFHSGGVSAMGYGFPASIGAYRAGKRETICMTGDGGMMLNLQELQTIAHHKLPIKIFVFANNGYHTIRMMQDNHFKRHSISSPETGLSCPDFAEVAKAFGIPTWSMFSNSDCEQWMDYVLTRKHPILCVVHVSPDQIIAPRVQSKLENGKFAPGALDEMWPPIEGVKVLA